MPWKESKPMDERLRFIARLLEGEKMAPLCREFGISRPTGYKIFERYKECGLDGLNDRSRRPYRQSNRLPFQVERTILGIKREYPSWGAPKIREKLIRQYPMIKPPAISTVHAVLDRNGLVKRRKRRRHKAKGTTLTASHEPNGLWCADYKGEFALGNRQYCYPLTITDYHSRYLPHGQRHSVRVWQCVVRAIKTFSLVVAPWHTDPAHQARQPATKRPSRTHASDLKKGNHQARCV